MITEAARRALQAGDPGAALDLLDTCGVRDADWHTLRGMAQLAREAWTEALYELMAAMAAGDTQPATALNLALARAGGGDVDAALAAIDNLEAANPGWSELPFRRAEILRGAGRAEAAIAAYEQALELAPRRADALLRLGVLHLLQGNARTAETVLLRCCGVAPGNHEAWDALGVASGALGDTVAAEAAFSRAHALQPTSLPVALRFAHMAAANGHAEAEIARLERASPLDAVALAARAMLHVEQGRDALAHELLEAAVTVAPHSAELANLRADTIMRGNRSPEVVAALEAALALHPDSYMLRNNLSVALSGIHRHTDALTVLDALAPEHCERPEVYCSRAVALYSLGRQAEAVAMARHATTLAPHALLVWKTLANALLYSEEASNAVLAPVLARASGACPRPALPALPVARGPDKRLRVGLLSAALRTHPVGWLTLPGWENLDPNAFELVCIAQAEGSDPMQRRFRAAAAEWHPMATGPTPDLARRVRALELNILVDLSGYSDPGLLGHCAARLAPVQVKWVGMQNCSTGIPEIDWFVSDRWETPPELAADYTERLMLMPDGYACYAPPTHAPGVEPLPARRTGRVTFGCFNNLAKVTPRVVATWSAILARVPASRLVLKTHQLADPACARFVHDSFARHGIGAERVELRGGSSHRALLGEYGDIDFVLDPFPYSGGLTTCEAMWMGVPVLTCPGDTFASRHSASHMSNAGFADWVVPDLDAYVDEAVRRAADLDALASLRAGLRERMRRSPLCDGPRFGRHLGHALRHAWHEACATAAVSER